MELFLVAGCRDGDIRLTGGSSEREGTVEVCSDQTWGMVSGLGWGEKDARVVCRQMQFQVVGEVSLVLYSVYGWLGCLETVCESFLFKLLLDSISYADTPFGKPNLTAHYSSVQCTGSETRLTNCANSMLTFEEGKKLVEYTGVAGVSCRLDCQLPTSPVCPVTHCSPVEPHISQQAESALSGGGHALGMSLFAALSAILGTMTAAIGIW